MMTLSVAEARATFSRIVESASKTHERFEVTRNGSRAAVIMGADDFDALVETIEILGDSDMLTTITAGLGELAQNELIGSEQVVSEMRKAGRFPE